MHNLILTKVRHNGDIAISVAPSGIASTLQEGERTAHSTFNLPLNVLHNENPTHSLDDVALLISCKLIVCDVAAVSHKGSLESLDSTMKDLPSNNNIVGGSVLPLAGEFRQIIHVEEENVCLKKSAIWRFVQ